MSTNSVWSVAWEERDGNGREEVRSEGGGKRSQKVWRTKLHNKNARTRLYNIRYIRIHTQPTHAGDRFHCGCFCFRSEEHTSELQSLMRNTYAVYCLKKKIKI